MKSILYVGQFDPCCVAMRQRRWLRDLGVDFRVAVRDVWWRDHLDADWWSGGPGWSDERADELARFAAECDLLVYCPAIAAPWATATNAPNLCESMEPLPTGFQRTGRKIALFHGSPNLARFAERYAQAWRASGWEIAATTVDYALRMDARLVPSVVDLPDFTAAFRKPSERLRVIQTVTDPASCGTTQFLGLFDGTLAADAHVRAGMEHHACLATKAAMHAGFDHMRGSFSINSLENAALGLVNLVGTTAQVRAYLPDRLGVPFPPWPVVESWDGLRAELGKLALSSDLTEDLQWRGKRWFEQHWHPRKTAERVLEAYSEG